MSQPLKPGFVVIDANSLGYFHHNGKKLRTKAGKETQGIFGFMRSLSEYQERWPRHTLIVLWDGHAQWRYDLLPKTEDHCGYKGERDKDPTQAAMRQAYKEIRPDIQKACRLLGVRQMVADDAEADDLAQMVVERSEADNRHTVVVTGDGDWLQLVSEKTELYNIRTHDRITHKNFYDETGYKNARAFVEGKCLAGDASDKVPGVGKIGEKGAMLVLAEFGSIPNLIKRGREEDISDWPKKLRDFVTNANGGLEILKRNIKLMDLSKAQRPAVGSVRVDHGTPDISELVAFLEEHWFESFLLDLEGFLRHFPAYRNINIKEGVPA